MEKIGKQGNAPENMKGPFENEQKSLKSLINGIAKIIHLGIQESDSCKRHFTKVQDLSKASEEIRKVQNEFKKNI